MSTSYVWKDETTEHPSYSRAERDVEAEVGA